MLFTQNYQNEFVLVVTTACQSWRIFWDTVLSNNDNNDNNNKSIGWLPTNAGFAAIQFHALRTKANGTKRSLHAEMTAAEVSISTLLIIYKMYTAQHKLHIRYTNIQKTGGQPA